MKFCKLIMKYLTNGNLSDESYEIAKEDMHSNNVLMLRILSSISSAILLV